MPASYTNTRATARPPHAEHQHVLAFKSLAELPEEEIERRVAEALASPHTIFIYDNRTDADEWGFSRCTVLAGYQPVLKDDHRTRLLVQEGDNARVYVLNGTYLQDWGLERPAVLHACLDVAAGAEFRGLFNRRFKRLTARRLESTLALGVYETQTSDEAV